MPSNVRRPSLRSLGLSPSLLEALANEGPSPPHLRKRLHRYRRLGEKDGRRSVLGLARRVEGRKAVRGGDDA
jgi:hypothetical protein